MQRKIIAEDRRKENREVSNEHLTHDEARATEQAPKKKGRILDIMAYLLCLLIAVGIWAYVTITEADTYEYRFTGVVVNLEGVGALANSSDLSPISGEGQEITVTVKGSRSEIAKYTAEDIFAYVDLSSINMADRHTLEINIDLPGNMQLISANPAKITVFVDETIEKQVPIKVDLLYSAENNINVLSPEIEDGDVKNQMITVTGPRTVVDYISHALVKKDIGKISSGVKFNSTFTLIDKTGDSVTNPYVKTDVSEVSVKVDVTAEKIIPINAIYDTDPDDKYIYTLLWEYNGAIVKNVRIVGDPEVVALYESIDMRISDITSAPNGSFTLPDDVAVYIGSNKVSTISYTINKALREN